MNYSNLISDYRIVKVDHHRKTEELGGYQPIGTKYFIEMKTKNFFGTSWDRLCSFRTEKDALNFINDKIYGNTKHTETIVWTGETGEVR